MANHYEVNVWKYLRIAMALLLISGIGVYLSLIPARAMDMSAVSVNITIKIAPLLAPTVTNGVGATAVTATTARLNGEVTSTGNENPTIDVFYGTADGGTNPLSWDNTYNLGAKTLGIFYYDEGGLLPTTLYYYRMRATNSGGTTWALTSANFTTTVLFDPPTGFTLTDLGAVTITANWTKGAGSTYTMIRARRNAYPTGVADGEIIYYGDAESVNATGYALDTSTYYFVAISYLADNVTYNANFTQAIIGGEGMTGIADALNNFTTSFSGLTSVIGMMAEVFLILGLLAMAQWRRDVIWHSAAGLACLIIGIGWIKDYSGIGWAVIALATFQLLEAVLLAAGAGGGSKGLSQFEGVINAIKNWF